MQKILVASFLDDKLSTNGNNPQNQAKLDENTAQVIFYPSSLKDRKLFKLLLLPQEIGEIMAVGCASFLLLMDSTPVTYRMFPHPKKNATLIAEFGFVNFYFTLILWL